MSEHSPNSTSHDSSSHTSSPHTSSPVASSPVAAFIVLIVIAALLGWMMGAANDGRVGAIVVSAVLFLAFGAFGLLSLAKD